MLDANDNPPYFTPVNYTANVPEDTPTGTTLITINASDADSVSLGLGVVFGRFSKRFMPAMRPASVWCASVLVLFALSLVRNCGGWVMHGRVIHECGCMPFALRSRTVLT